MPKTRNHFKIGINLSRDNTIIKSIDVPFINAAAGQLDKVSFSMQKIVITAVCSKKFKANDILSNKGNGLYQQILKSIIYLYVVNGERVRITKIRIERSTTRVHEVESIALSNEQQMSLKKQVGIQQEIASFMQNQTMILMDWSADPSASSGTVTRVFRLYGKSTGWLAFLCAFLRQCSGCTQCFGKLSNRALRQVLRYNSGTTQGPCGGGWRGTLRQAQGPLFLGEKRKS